LGAQGRLLEDVSVERVGRWEVRVSRADVEVSTAMNIDKAGRAYWDELWAEKPAVAAPSAVAYLQKRFQRFFATVFKNSNTHGSRLLEAGCGPISNLPYFANQFGFTVTGIDYSPTACEQARGVLMRKGIAGEIICADFFDPPEDLRERFDVVFSSGVAEHFTETSDCIECLASFLKPGGLMITSIPNLTGIAGTIQRIINRPIFDVHVPLDKEALADAHESAGLNVIHCEYFMSTNFGIINLSGLPPNSLRNFAQKVPLALLTRLSYLSWILEDHSRQLTPNRFTSPYVNCIAEKPA
jgi:2-polyprenyl-3-methyl-5-hydroxy-6-metoxy-1,4-benzoquinol methylase